jgi:uncharacterized OB-fold protein
MEISDQEVLDRYPWGLITHDNKNHWKGFLQHKLLINCCQSCGYWIHEPRPMCPKCWSDNVKPQEVSGKGKIKWFTLLYQGSPVPGFDYSNPYPVVVIELAEQEGLRMAATMVNCSNQDICCDMPVELTWIERQGAPLPAFQPITGVPPQQTNR